MTTFFAVLGILLALITLVVSASMGLLALRYARRHAEVGAPPPAAILRLATRLKGVFRGMEASLSSPSERLLMMAHGHLVSQYIITLVRGGVADAVTYVPRSAAALAEELDLDPVSITHMLRVLSGHGCFHILKGTESMVQHNAVSALLRADHPQSVQPIVMVLAETYAASADTAHLASTGAAAFPFVNGGQRFTEALFPLPGDETKGAQSGAQMLRAADHAFFRLNEGALLMDYPWGEHTRIVDVSASSGRFLAPLLRLNRTLTGEVWDTPDMANATREWWSRSAGELNERIRFYADGEHAEAPPLRSGDALLCAFALHALDDDAALEFLLRLRRRIGSLTVPLIVVDVVRSSSEADRALLLLDAHARSHGSAIHRTMLDWNSLLLAAGFSTAELSPCRGYASVLVARPRPGVDIATTGAGARSATSDIDSAAEENAARPLLTPDAA